MVRPATAGVKPAECPVIAQVASDDRHHRRFDQLVEQLSDKGLRLLRIT